MYRDKEIAVGFSYTFLLVFLTPREDLKPGPEYK